MSEVWQRNALRIECFVDSS